MWDQEIAPLMRKTASIHPFIIINLENSYKWIYFVGQPELNWVIDSFHFENGPLKLSKIKLRKNVSHNTTENSYFFSLFDCLIPTQLKCSRNCFCKTSLDNNIWSVSYIPYLLFRKIYRKNLDVMLVYMSSVVGLWTVTISPIKCVLDLLTFIPKWQKQHR